MNIPQLGPMRRPNYYPKPWDEVETILLIEMYNEGKSYIEMSATLNRSEQSICARLKRIRRGNGS
jgi:hypothetical protein